VARVISTTRKYGILRGVQNDNFGNAVVFQHPVRRMHENAGMEWFILSLPVNRSTTDIRIISGNFTTPTITIDPVKVFPLHPAWLFAN